MRPVNLMEHELASAEVKLAKAPEAKVTRAPGEPSREEVVLHNAIRAGCPAWCEIYVFAKGESDAFNRCVRREGASDSADGLYVHGYKC